MALARSRINTESGFSLVEVLAATVILTVALMSLAQLFAISTRSNFSARSNTFVWPAIDDPFVADRTRGIITLAKYLRDRETYGVDRQRAEEQGDIEAVTGVAYETHAGAVADLCRLAAQIPFADARPLVECLLSTARRRQTIWAAAMGSMTHRTIDYQAR